MRKIVSNVPHQDIFERLVQSDDIKYHKLSAPGLDIPISIGLNYLNQLKITNNIEFEVGDVAVLYPGEDKCSLSFKILNDDMIGYMVALSNDTFMWTNKDHSSGIHPDVVIAHFLSQSHPNLDIKVVVDDKHGSKIEITDKQTGNKVTSIDDRTSEDRIKMGERH